PQATRTWKVGVATTFVPDSEPIELLEQMLEALVAIESPHDTWVLDEGDDDRVKQLCERFGARHYSRKGDARYQSEDGPFKSRTKYGNYNAWFAEHGFAEYEIITSFDTDHLPEPRFLDRVLSYFQDPKIGYVQAAQAYGNDHQTWVARGAAEERFDYFSTFQMAGNGMGFPIIVGGHNTHRVSALREIDGFGAHNADDELTTLHYRDAGWRGVYVPEVLAYGLAPVDLPTYLTQQRRWARSALDLKFRVHSRLASDQTVLAKVLSFLHGFNYLLKGLQPVMTLVAAGAICLVGGDLVMLTSAAILPAGFLIAALGLSGAFRQQFYLDPVNERGLHWRSWLLYWAAWPQMLFAIGDVIRNRRVPYTVTAKHRTQATSHDWLWPHVATAALLVLCWFIGVTRGQVGVAGHVMVALLVLTATVLALTALWDHRQSAAASVLQVLEPQTR
ncbi:MAG: glycosyltransferase, partial [Planctomycetaceae bacterium]|nr:glycosyltransferase [Planctomycetaceae bacterium]